MNEFSLKMHAMQAGDQFLESGVPLNDSIAKIASATRLAPNEIFNVASMANHHVNQALLKKADQKLFEFDLARFDKILEKLGSSRFDPEGLGASVAKRTANAAAEYSVSPEDRFRDVFQEEKVATAAGFAKHASFFNGGKEAGLEPHHMDFNPGPHRIAELMGKMA